MSAPRNIIQILIIGTQIFGKALLEAGRQAARNAKHRPAISSSDAAGVSNATSSSPTDKLTREHRMTMDEAHLILNVKRGEPLAHVLKNYEHLFQVNSAPAEPAEAGRRTKASYYYSHYLQSKVVRARERIEAEAASTAESPAPPEPPQQTPSPPP